MCRKRSPLRQCQLWYRLAGGVLEISIGHFRLHVSEAVEVVWAVGRKELVDEFEIGMGHIETQIWKGTLGLVFPFLAYYIQLPIRVNLTSGVCLFLLDDEAGLWGYYAPSCPTTAEVQRAHDVINLQMWTRSISNREAVRQMADECLLHSEACAQTKNPRRHHGVGGQVSSCGYFLHSSGV